MTCPATAGIPPTEVLTIPHAVFERAKLKARLSTLLRESLYDDAAHKINAAREKEIRNLAKKLSKGEL